MFLRLTLPLLVVVAGCANTNTPAPTTTASAAPEQTCHQVYKVGSTIPVKDCSAPLTEAERARMVDELRQQFNKPVGTAPP